MRVFRWIFGAALIFAATGINAAEGLGSVTGAFYLRAPGEGVPSVTSALLDTPIIHYVLRGTNLSAGEHFYRCRIFDGKGREAFSIGFNVTPKKTGEWQAWVHYQPNRAADSPGIWWFASELDNKALSSEKLEILPLSGQ